jgi:prepilin-type N-terminal cleavage/methylation domain-containing protein
MKQGGFTLIELLVVTAIIGILVVVTGFEFTGWMSRYEVESEIKQMHADLMSARVKAMQKNMQYVTALSNDLAIHRGKYVICEDTNPANNACDNPAETTTSVSRALSKSGLRYQLNWGLLGGGNTITMDRRGIASPNGTIWLVQDGGAAWGPDVDYDCIIISDVKTDLGKYDGANCQAK